MTLYLLSPPKLSPSKFDMPPLPKMIDIAPPAKIPDKPPDLGIKE
jgi:hypothetical protein